MVMHTLLKYLSRNPYVMPRKQFGAVWLATFLVSAGLLLWITFSQEPRPQHLTWPQATCHVTEYAYNPQVVGGYICEYKVNDIVYSILTHSTSHRRNDEAEIGKSHTVLYDPSNPQLGYSPEIALPLYILLLVFSFIFGVSVIIGGFIAWRKNMLRTRAISQLIANGTAIEATVVGTTIGHVGKGTVFTTIHVAPTVSKDGMLDRYSSDKVWSYYKWLQVGTPARVYINKTDPHQYYVDLDFWEEYFAK
ncbi:hypothetical protein IPM09_01705 [Candidatus Saccharibacteria bacterium]|nr:MAG: hypothetical protein IPM09_01705 [Candidatus Saccharibacteria bacterium]